MDPRNYKETISGRLFGSFYDKAREILFRTLSNGPIPNHLAFILDGNRRYARKWNLGEGMGHRAGFLSLLSVIKYCYELGVRYITLYTFSIDNFKRKPEQVEYLMDLMLEKIEGLLEEKSIVNEHGVRVYFIGNLKLLNDRVRTACEKAMKATADNDRCVLLICMPYTSTDEIAHAAQVCCEDKRDEISNKKKAGTVNLSNGIEEIEEDGDVIKLSDVEKHMYMSVAPDPDVLIRTSGETRLSNFLLWQTTNCILYSPETLWPEIGLRDLVWAVLNFQRTRSYFDKVKKKM